MTNMANSSTNHRLLLVDDDPRNLALLKARSAPGHECVCAHGHESVAMFESARLDLVFSTMMP